MNGPIPDHSQRARATDVGRSVIVQAPAGSGKTTLLVERYLKLLAIVEKPEEILAITFTRKAASEMQSRILEALDDSNRQPAETGQLGSVAAAALQRSNALGWQLLEQPNRLKIQTIDAFALSLSRSLPVASGFDPTLRLTENAEPHYQKAAQRLLLRLYEDNPFTDEIADFLSQCDNDAGQAKRLLARMLGKRDQWLSVAGSVVGAAQQHPEHVAEVLERGLESLNEEAITTVQQALGDGLIGELEDLVEHAGQALAQTVESRFQRYRLAAEIFTTAKGELRKQIDRRQGFSTDHPHVKARALVLIRQMASLGLDDQLADLRHLPDPELEPQTVRGLINVCMNLTLANSELELVFNQARTTDFTSLILNAGTALGDESAPSELALSLDYRIHHVLVDEFQDTSVSQYRLLEMLLRGWYPGDGNTFFAVGDPMQSIYRFRDADVSLFFRAQEVGIGDVRLEPVSLTSNFRADPQLVDWTNHAFGRIMETHQNPLMGQIRHHPAVSTRDQPTGHPAVSLNLHSSRTGQVAQIAATIEALLKETEGSIAVLVRSRGQLTELIATLRRMSIRWHANDIDPLLEKPAVIDLLALAATLSDPSDRLSWFTLLRTPLVGLTLEDLTALTTVEHFPALLREPDSVQLSASGRTRLDRLAAAWLTLADKQGEYPPRSILETLWVRLGGADAYGEAAALSHVTRLLELIDDLGPDGLSPSVLAQAAGALFATDSTPSRLEILTIHKSKGLEFDHVLVPFLERTTQTDEAELLLWRASPDGLLMGVRNDEGPFDWLAREDRSRERHERQRLLYVACTRARHTLTLFATPQERPPATAMLSLLWPLVEQHDAGQLMIRYPDGPMPAIEAPQAASSETATRPDPGLTRLREGYRWHRPTETEVLAGPEPFTPEPNDPLTGRAEVVIGLIVHAALEKLAGRPLPDDITAYLTRERPGWHAMTACQELEPQVAGRVLDIAGHQIAGVLEDPDGRWLLGAHQDGQTELAITGVDEEHIRKYVIDRTFVADGQRWVVDYKTATPPAEADLGDFVQSEVGRYQASMRRYGHLADTLFGQAPTLALYFTALPRLVIVV